MLIAYLAAIMPTTNGHEWTRIGPTLQLVASVHSSESKLPNVTAAAIITPPSTPIRNMRLILFLARPNSCWRSCTPLSITPSTAFLSSRKWAEKREI
jgi:hypothetical protein